MTRPLAVLFVLVQALDFATFSVAPHLEANPLMAALPVVGVALLKACGVAAALLIASRLRPPAAAFALGVGIALGAFGVGTNTATLLTGKG